MGSGCISQQKVKKSTKVKVNPVDWQFSRKRANFRAGEELISRRRANFRAGEIGRIFLQNFAGLSVSPNRP
jgi:hypothetical protein